MVTADTGVSGGDASTGEGEGLADDLLDIFENEVIEDTNMTSLANSLSDVDINDLLELAESVSSELDRHVQ